MIRSVLITGGLGYIGGRVAQALCAAGIKVTLGTRRQGQPPPSWLPEAAIAYLDWNSKANLQTACAGIDCIIHLAAMNENDAVQDPVGALEMNGVASLRLLEAAIAIGIPRFIYFSTAHVYGAPLEGSIDEKKVPRPLHPYAITHKVTEDFVLAAHDQKRIEGVVLRLSNGFGEPATPDIDRWTLIANDLCRQAAQTGELRLRTPGTQLRDFITLEDVARAVLHTIRLDPAALQDGLFNLGGDASIPVFSMAEHVAASWKEQTGRELPIHRPEPSGPPHPPLYYSCEKFKSTGFSLTGRVRQEIDATLRLCLNAFGTHLQ